jgi:hypothetical protein
LDRFDAQAVDGAAAQALALLELVADQAEDPMTAQHPRSEHHLDEHNPFVSHTLTRYRNDGPTRGLCRST